MVHIVFIGVLGFLRLGVGVLIGISVSSDVEPVQRVRISINGGIDAHTVVELDECFKEVFGEGAVRFVVDLSGVNFVSVAALKYFIKARDQARKAGGNLVILGARSEVSEISKLLGLEDLISFVATLEEAQEVFCN